MHWSIANSSECMSKIENVNAHSVNTFDFSTLYTNLPLILNMTNSPNLSK